MNPEESQTPEPIDEWLAQIGEDSSSSEVPENSSVEPVAETEAQRLLVETLPEDATLKPLISQPVGLTTTSEPIQESTGELVTLGSESADNSLYAQAAQQVAELQNTKAALKAEIANLQATYNTLQTQLSETQLTLGRVVIESLAQLEQRKQTLQISVEQLERRQERIRNEMRTTFAGTSQDLAIRVQGFKDYLTGSLQDLAAAAEQLQLVPACNSTRTTICQRGEAS